MTLLAGSQDRILHITLNRPEKRNALNAGICRGIVDAIEAAQHNEDIACVMITANGPVFCAGMDLDEALSADQAELSELHESLFTIGARSIKPIIVGVNGAALGGGLGLAVQGHAVFAGQKAFFGLPEINVGLWPFLVYRSVSAAIGSRRALGISLSGNSFTASQAAEWGLVHHTVADGEVEERCRSMARRLARASPLALRFGMQYVQESTGKPWKDAGELAAQLRVKLMESEDFKEGHLAFKQKRDAHWPSMPAHFYKKKADS
jgi:enoyl-CoA hydratase/carnithine racemase